MKPLWRMESAAAELLANYPSRISDRNKQIVFETACPPGTVHSGTVSVSRWDQLELPERVVRTSTRPEFELQQEYFTYDPSPAGQFDWHLNFAHYDLFCCYSGPLFAQDEMQVAEHPALASVREWLLDSGKIPYTVERERATPILIKGAERRVAVATAPDASAGRPYGLYGNNFARADEAAIRNAIQVLQPPTISNIIAIEAPACGYGIYTLNQIEFILANALTGFQAARHDSPPDLQVAIHTGYWGCGAYGGNCELMPLLQMIAACCSGIDRLIFHTGGDPIGYDQAKSVLEELLPEGSEIETSELLDQIENRGYEWGVSDGN